jgi:hypothetical protein
MELGMGYPLEKKITKGDPAGGEKRHVPQNQTITETGIREESYLKRVGCRQKDRHQILRYG